MVYLPMSGNLTYRVRFPDVIVCARGFVLEANG